MFQKRGLNLGSLIKNSSSQGKLLLMLNGDYAAELPGSGINAREMQGRTGCCWGIAAVRGMRVHPFNAGRHTAGCPAASAGFVMGLWDVCVCVCAHTPVLISHQPAER